ncbi:hypothetical protein Poli38472_001977 [Pythium oligandrum]|uniref:Phosphatidate cytidylyltransferase n=1 Tax=Pythium oligandrum TaxID=41045 RepID=A0A8K1CWD1_PYTOL|nr:hypothetical protein Poli38472_001977 [Pythium oligandrum]|eukprot:TMW69821.1 hypothetical protein Poli38472_001977 [Pythium oligandrum]
MASARLPHAATATGVSATVELSPTRDSPFPSPREDEAETRSTDTTDAASGGDGMQAHPNEPMWRRLLRLNFVQRCLSAIILAPLVTIFLWQSPAFATATVCTGLTSLCSYEYAWLAHRIQHRFRRQFSLILGDSREPVGEMEPSLAQEPRSPTSLRRLSHLSNTGRKDGEGAAQSTTPEPRDDVTPRSEAVIDQDFDDDEIFKHTAVTDIANRFFGGHEWIAAMITSAFVAAFFSMLFLFAIVRNFPDLKKTEFYEFRIFYTITTDYISALCACFTPNRRYAVLLLGQNTIFTLLTIYSTICPINQFTCSIDLEPVQLVLVTIGFLLVFRIFTSRDVADAASLFALDLLGFIYIIGTLSVLVAFVDDDKRALYRKLLIVLLYVTWASDSGAYVTGKLLVRWRYPYYHPLAAHLSKNKDYEGTLGAIIWGIAAMLVASNLLDVQGSVWIKILFTVLGVIVGRFGDLFESLLKRAANVKDSGTLIPGHGGVLDRIDALMFITLVFARYYSTVIGLE